MALIKKQGDQWFPSVFDNFFSDLDGLFADRRPALGQMVSAPAVNIRETEKSFRLELAAPGLQREDFEVEVDAGKLTISAEHKIENEAKNEEGRYTRREFSYQSFKRSFSLPEGRIDEDNIKASYKDGVLQLELPKQDDNEKPSSRRIEIS